jgi:hypothetical protein
MLHWGPHRYYAVTSGTAEMNQFVAIAEKAQSQRSSSYAKAFEKDSPISALMADIFHNNWFMIPAGIILLFLWSFTLVVLTSFKSALHVCHTVYQPGSPFTGITTATDMTCYNLTTSGTCDIIGMTSSTYTQSRIALMVLAILPFVFLGMWKLRKQIIMSQSDKEKKPKSTFYQMVMIILLILELALGIVALVFDSGSADVWGNKCRPAFDVLNKEPALFDPSLGDGFKDWHVTIPALTITTNLLSMLLIGLLALPYYINVYFYKSYIRMTTYDS